MNPLFLHDEYTGINNRYVNSFDAQIHCWVFLHGSEVLKTTRTGLGQWDSVWYFKRPAALTACKLPVLNGSRLISVVRFTLVIMLLLPTASFSQGNNLPIDMFRTGQKNDSQVTLGYWNDNFLSKKIFDTNTTHNRDDFQTANFWLHMTLKQSRGWRFYDSYFTILTHKENNFRTDLLAFRLSREYPIFRGPLRIGFGLAANGDFGGSSIQNVYHGVFGYRKVDLPYSVASHIGGITSLRFTPVILKANRFELKGFTSNYLRTAIIPCNSRAGLEFDAFHAFKKMHIRCQILGGVTGITAERVRLFPFSRTGLHGGYWFREV